MADPVEPANDVRVNLDNDQAGQVIQQHQHTDHACIQGGAI